MKQPKKSTAIKTDASRETAVDPYQLLKALSVFLTPKGAIRGENEVVKILNLMKAARKLVSRCIYINIVRATTESSIQNKFISAGGWDVLNMWLQEAKELNNTPLILELIKVFKQLPVSIEILKKTNTAKIIKQYSKGDGAEDIKTASTDLVDTWMKVIRGAPAEKPELPKKKKLKKTSSEKGEQSKTEPPKVKSEEKRSQRTSKDENQNVDDEDDDDDKPLVRRTKSEDSTKSETNNHDRLESSSEKKVDRKRHHSKDGEEKDDKKKDDNKDSKKADKKDKSERKVEKFSIKKEKVETSEEKSDRGMRPRTVKTKHTKMRSTGLEMETELKVPPLKIKKHNDKAVIVKSDPPPKAIKREGPLLSKILTPPEKKLRPERRTSLTGPTRIKVIPPRPRLQESSGFLDALNAPTEAVRKKVKKVVKPHTASQIKDLKSKPEGGTKPNEKSSPVPPEESKADKPEPPKFNFYSNAEPEDGKDDDKMFGEIAADKDENEKDDAQQGSKSNLKLLPSRNKKSVRWKEDDELVDIRFFEVDQNERENVHRLKDFRCAAQLELKMEKQAMQNFMKQSQLGAFADEDKDLKTIEFLPWKKPALLDVAQLVEAGIQSKERQVQADREMTVLQELYFDKAMLPDTPKEPDPETVEHMEPVRMPLDDESTAEADQMAYSQTSTPPYQGNPNQVAADLPPDLANIVNQLPVGGAVQPGMPSWENIQEALNTVMNPQQQASGSTSPNVISDELTNKLKDIIAPLQGLPPPGHPPPPPQSYMVPPMHQEELPPQPYDYNQDQYQMGYQEQEYEGMQGGHDMGPMPPYHDEMGPEFDDPGYQQGPPPLFPGPDNSGHYFGGGMGPRGPPPRFPGRGRRRGRGGHRPPKICYHFMGPRGCRLDDRCSFIHPRKQNPR